ncbi:MAG: hypothetical protein IPN63_05250 [Gammaproteobacteria bacterium]|nr:hypothetical protein [Gammaproteobacteria bacterium]
MRNYIKYVASGIFLGLVSAHAVAEVIDPEKHVLKNGYHSVKMGDDGKTRFYSFTERAASPRIAALETEIAKLPKHVEVQKMCDFMRGATKAKLIEQRGIAIDVAVTNYGYSGATVACVLKYMHDSNVGTQLIYNKKGAGGMYMVFVTD